jgi:glycosyltransferase involved in cell wall biosynthesis
MTQFVQDSRVSIIIPVHNAGENFRLCLASVAAAVFPADEIIVVADGNTDGSTKLAEASGACVISLPENMGPARARNAGAEKSSGDILLFIDADITIPADTVARVTASFKREPELAALFGSYDEEPFDRGFLSQYKNLFHHYTHQTANENASTFWTGCGAIRRRVFMAQSGFNEDYRRPSIEDIELGYRLKKAGYRVRLDKDLKVKHLKSWGVISLLRADFLYRALPWTLLILREGGMLNDLNLKRANRLSVVCVYLLIASIVAALNVPWFCLLSFLLMVTLLALNRDLYRFFNDKRGSWFAMKTIPWTWLYYLYSGLAFSLGFVRFRLSRVWMGAN